MKIQFLITTVMIFGLSSFGWSEVSEPPKKLRALSVDFDDTFMHTNSRIYIYNKDSGEEVAVTTKDFAEVGEVLGKTGPFENFELRTPDEQKSFRDFRDKPKQNVFLNTIKRTIETSDPKAWKGPIWNEIVDVLNSSEGARWFSVITARGHEPPEVHEALEFLSDLNYFKFIPTIDHIFTVGSTEWRKLNQPTEKLKVLAMQMVLDDLQKEVLRRQLLGENIRGEFIFVDDDFQNFEKAERGLNDLAHRWPDVDLIVSYVGSARASASPMSVRVLPKKPSELFCHELIYY